MKYYMLASGSKGNCFVLQTQASQVVIDCGTTKSYLTRSFRNIDVSLDHVDALFLTHDHSDHISQVSLFKDHDIYAPFPLLDVSKLHLVAPFEPFHIRDLTVIPLPLSHDTEINVGYIIQSGGEKLVYVTDTGYIRERDYPLLRDADYYIFESNHDPEMLMNSHRPYYLKKRILSDTGHLSNQDSAEALAQMVTSRTKEVVLAHISQECNTYELAYTMTATRLAPLSGATIKVAKQFEIMQGGHQE